MYAEIAIGSTLPLHFYEGLHDQVLALPDPGTPSCFPPSGAEASNKTNITPTGNYIICLVSVSTTQIKECIYVLCLYVCCSVGEWLFE